MHYLSRRLAMWAVLFLGISTRHGFAAVVFSEDFSLGITNWTVRNNSSPMGTATAGWYAGPTTTTLLSGDAVPNTLFASTNFDTVDASGTSPVASNWLISPIVSFTNGDTLSFTTSAFIDQTFPDRLQVWMNAVDTSVNVGTTASSVGSFGRLMLDINPTYATTLAGGGYPMVWTGYQIPITGITGTIQGRFAFRYLLTDPTTQGNEIGVDNVVLDRPTVVPEPVLALPVMFAALLLRRQRRMGGTS